MLVLVCMPLPCNTLQRFATLRKALEALIGLFRMVCRTKVCPYHRPILVKHKSSLIVTLLVTPGPKVLLRFTSFCTFVIKGLGAYCASYSVFGTV